MHDVLRSTEVRQTIAKIVAELAITHFAAVDDHLLALEVADVKRVDFFIAQSSASGTNLGTSIQSLSETASTLYFLTDADGLRSLGDAAVHDRIP
jgi:pilus assembly protein TadC